MNDLIFCPDRLQECVAEARLPILDGDPGPSDINDLDQLKERLVEAASSLPSMYRIAAHQPLLKFLQSIDRRDFAEAIMRRDSAVLMGDAVQAILQRTSGFERDATIAFQEVVSDLYDGFLSAEDRRGVRALAGQRLAPLVKWGRPDIGPYAFAAEQMASVGLSCGVVNLPPAYARGGVFGWGVLAHETAGHAIVAGDAALLAQLTQAVRLALEAGAMAVAGPSGTSPASGHHEAELWIWHWTRLIDELAADVLGVLNMGPAAAVAALVYLRALRQAYGGGPCLNGISDLLDRHPADILRLVALAEVVRIAEGPPALLDNGADPGSGSSDAHQLAFALEWEAANDLNSLVVDGYVIQDMAGAWRAARCAARAVVTTALPALQNVSLLSIQGWRASDENIVAMIRPLLTTAQGADDRILGGFYAAHVVAAAVMEVFHSPKSGAIVFRRMVRLLAAMHQQNAAWGPLAAAYPGNLVPRSGGTGSPHVPLPAAGTVHTPRGGGSPPVPWPLIRASSKAQGRRRPKPPSFLPPPVGRGTGSPPIPLPD